METRTEAGEALTDLILETFRLNGAMLEAGNKLTKPHGLTSARWQVMGAIDLAGHAMTVAQISRRMGLSRQGVQRIVNELVKSGLLELEDNIDHKRAPLVVISEAGQRAMIGVNRAQALWVNQLAENLNTRQVKQAVSLMKSIRERTEQS
ncbi:MAG: helix-turn-helix domain-containing protein [Pseudomonadota bacterium]